MLNTEFRDIGVSPVPQVIGYLAPYEETTDTREMQDDDGKDDLKESAGDSKEANTNNHETNDAGYSQEVRDKGRHHRWLSHDSKGRGRIMMRIHARGQSSSHHNLS